ncbi:MAG: A/G-specific adenine glycosylase, partial [Bacteroidetes bacterium]
LLHQRQGQDVWQGLFQFPLVETIMAVDHWQDLLLAPNWPEWLPAPGLQLTRKAGPYQQTLTHQRIIATFWELSWDHQKAWQLPAEMRYVKRKNWTNFAFPKVIHLYLADNSLTLF